MVYALAPAGIRATELPEQMVALFTAMVGVVFTDTVDTTAFKAAQPLEPPVTV